MFLAEPEIRRHRFRHFVKGGAVRSKLVPQRFRKAFVFHAKSHRLFAGIAARVWLAFHHHSEHAIFAANFFEVAYFVVDVRGPDRARRTNHDEKPARIQRAIDRRRKISIRRQFLFIAKHRKDAFWNGIAALVRRARKIARYFVSLDRVMQPRRPLPPFLFVIGVPIADETPIARAIVRGWIELAAVHEMEILERLRSHSLQCP